MIAPFARHGVKGPAAPAGVARGLADGYWSARLTRGTMTHPPLRPSPGTAARNSPFSQEDPMKKILCTVDLSDRSSAVLQAAIRLARLDAGTVTVLRVHEPHAVTHLEELGDDFQPLLERGDRAAFQAWLEGERKGAAGVEIHERFEVGDPAATILDVAAEGGFDLLVIGNKGQSAIERFLLGSVTTKVLHHAPCNILLVK